MYISLVVCTFGCIANILNIVVLTRSEMRSPTNAILTGLAIADLCVMIDYIPYALYYGTLQCGNHVVKLSSSWTTYILVHANLSQVLHQISIFLTVILAVWRYIAVGFPHKNRVWCNMSKTIRVIIYSYIITPLISIPVYIFHGKKEAISHIYQNGTLVEKSINLTTEYIDYHGIKNVTTYRIGLSEYATSNEHFHQTIFVVYSGTSIPPLTLIRHCLIPFFLVFNSSIQADTMLSLNILECSADCCLVRNKAKAKKFDRQQS